MENDEIRRKTLDNQEFMQLRQTTEKISALLDKRLKDHLAVLRPLFLPKKLFGSYIKSASAEDVPGSDKAFAAFQEQYAAICESPFELPKKLKPPLPPISNQIQAVPYQYALPTGEGQEKATTITSPTRWVLAYQGDCPLNRLRAMIADREARQPDPMRQGIIDHLALVLFLKQFPAMGQLLEDLRYEVRVQPMADLGGLPVVMLRSPIEAFLPPDDFIFQITQLSGISEFKEIIDTEAVENIPDPLKASILETIS